MIALLFLAGLTFLPMFVSAHICKERNRNVVKGLVVTFFFGWFATFFLWMALKTRNSETKTLY